MAFREADATEKLTIESLPMSRSKSKWEREEKSKKLMEQRGRQLYF
jgi:hypothetical protein